RVDALAHHDVLGPDAMTLGERGLQVVVLGIAVFPALRRRLRHGGDGAWRWAEHVLVGADARAEHPAAAALLRLGADERHRGRERADDRGVARSPLVVICHDALLLRARATA